MADRNSIIEKIKALLAKTTANGAAEAEMMSALNKASAMMDAYDITDADVQVAKDEAAMLHKGPPDLKDPHKIKWRLGYGVSQFCGVQIFRSLMRLACSSSECRATCSSRCGCSITSPTSYLPSYMRT
jgi:hypothetical protein